MEINKVYVGNNLDVLKTFPDNSVDSIVTDPPYGLGKEPKAHEVLKDWLEHGYHEIKGKGFMGKEWDAFVPQPILWKECLRVLKPGGHLLSFAGTRTYDWVVMGLRLAGFEIRDQLAWIYGSGFPKSLDIYKNIYKISQDEAQKYFGWGTALKPALEPIVMARKPLEGTVANNVLKHGVGGINIDGCRVETDDKMSYSNSEKIGVTNFKTGTSKQNQNGRFPANVIHDGSDEVVSLFPITKSTEEKPNKEHTFKGNKDVFKWGFKDRYGSGFNDEGSAARFFYTAKASQSERNFGLSGFEEKSSNSKGNGLDRICEYCGVSQLKPELCHCEVKSWVTKPKKNIHPTVKPIDLMQYLVRLVTPKGGICLDPYLGSGTTAIACKSEKINYICPFIYRRC
jgi:site-specific DNA-methyltransferase (adenine-specific)